MFGFVVSMGLFVILWLLESYLRPKEIEDKKEGQVTSKADNVLTETQDPSSEEEKIKEKERTNNTDKQDQIDVERRKTNEGEMEEDENKTENDNIDQLKDKNVEEVFEIKQKGTLLQLRTPEFEESSSVENENGQDENELEGKERADEEEIKCSGGGDSENRTAEEHEKYSSEVEGTLHTTGGIEITDVTDQNDLIDNNEANGGTSRIKIVEIDEEETECEVENREVKFLIKRSGETSEIFKVSESSSSLSELSHEYDIRSQGGEIPIVSIEAVEDGEETKTVASLRKESNEQSSVMSQISENVNKTEGVVEVSDKASMIFQNATSKTDQNFETEVKTNADGSTTRIKKVTNVSVSRQEFRTQKVEVRSSCSSKFIEASSGSIQELLQGQGMKLDNIQVDPSLGISMGKSLSLMPSEDAEHSEEGAEETNLSRKLPFGGVRMFGGEELLAKIKKRRIDVDASENEGKGIETESGQMQTEEIAKENSGPEKPDSPESQSNTSTVDHKEDSDLTPALDDASSPSEEQEVYASHQSENDQSVELDLNIPASDCDSLIHLNKSRPKGPAKRKPSFNSPRPEE